MHEIVSACAGLVVVDQESAIVRLVHYTTQKYFERISSRLNPDGQLEIAKTCLTYLSFNVFKSGSCATDQEFEERLCQHELLDYAAKHCGEHARSVDAKVAYLVCALVTHSGILSCAAQVLSVPSYKYPGYSARVPAITGLHWIARFGLCDAAKEFLHRKEDETCAVNATDSYGRGSLMYAVEDGHCAMAELLFNKGAYINAQGRDLDNALWAASYRGHEAVVRRLLEEGADVNAQGGRFGNALWAASSNGYEAVVRLLLEKGADVNAQGGSFGDALWVASSNGHKAVARLLLEKGAKAQDRIIDDALLANLYEIQEALARLLREKEGEDGNAQGREDGNALHAAPYAEQPQDPYARTLL